MLSFISIEMGGACSTYGESIGAYRVLAGKPEGRSLLERSRLRWKGNTEMDLGEVGWLGGGGMGVS